jgi:hypothetical protein
MSHTDPLLLLCVFKRELRVAMLTLASKLKRDEGVKTGRAPGGPSDSSHRVSIRDRLLIKGTTHMTFYKCFYPSPPVSLFRLLASG